MNNYKETIPGKVAVKLDPRRKIFHYFSLGEIMTGNLFKFSNKTKYKIDLHVVKDPKAMATGNYGKFSSYYSVGDDWVLYERTYGGFKCNLFIRGLLTNTLYVYANSFYMNYIKARIDSLWPIGIHLTDILLYKLIGDNDLVLHGASLAHPKEKKAFLLLAPPDTGKTYTTFKLLEKGYKFLGEDLSFYDGQKDQLICMPYTSTWGHRFKLQKVDMSKIPFVGLLSNQNKKGVEEIFGSSSVLASAPLDRIYILEKTDGKEDISKVKVDDELIRKIISIQRNEFSYFKNPLLRAFEYYHPLNIDATYALESNNIVKLLGEKSVFLIKAPDHRSYEEIIHRHLTS